MKYLSKHRLIFIILILLILAGVLVFLFSRSEEPENQDKNDPIGYGNIELDPDATIEPETQEALNYLLETPEAKVEITETVNEQVKSAMQGYENITQQNFQCISRMAGVKVDNQYLCLKLSQQAETIVVDSGILMQAVE